MALADDLQILAFEAVTEESGDYRLRYLYRWYSKTYHTPLHIVPTLLLPDILTAFFESRYEAMSPEELEDERQLLIETEAQRQVRLRAADKERVEAEQFFADNQTLAQTEAKKVTDIKMAPLKPVRTNRPLSETELPEPPLDSSVRPLPENVSIRFAPTDFFNEMIDRLDGVSEDDPEQS